MNFAHTGVLKILMTYLADIKENSANNVVPDVKEKHSVLQSVNLYI
jgi:hypothetical protein